MMWGSYDEPLEKYSSYKKRMRERTLVKLLKLINGIDQLSLKLNDKKLLKKQCKEYLNKHI